jgi:hypothetical protein
MEEREFVAGESRRSFVPRTALESPGAQIRVGNHDIHRLRIGPDIALSFSQRWSALHVRWRVVQVLNINLSSVALSLSRESRHCITELSHLSSTLLSLTDMQTLN